MRQDHASIVLALNVDYLPEGSLDSLLSGEFRVLGKVTEVALGSREISLYQRQSWAISIATRSTSYYPGSRTTRYHALGKSFARFRTCIADYARSDLHYRSCVWPGLRSVRPLPAGSTTRGVTPGWPC